MSNDTDIVEARTVREVVRKVLTCNDEHFEKAKQGNWPIYRAASLGYAAALASRQTDAPEAGLVDEAYAKGWHDGERAGAEGIEALVEALHAAIASPKGVVPKAAEAFYRQDYPAIRDEGK